ncbi:MAG: hypothetical protein ACE5D7_02070, partial [Fidelibacterota bacterium]
MKLKFPQILLITFFSSIFCASLEMIPSISVKYGTKKGIDLGNYRIKNDDVFRVQKIDGFDFWVAGDSLYVTAQPSAKGIHPVNLSLGDEKFTLILKALPSIEVDFIYPGDKGAKSVHVMGYFNDWSRTSDGLSIEKDGNWHLKQYFEPGTYEYKFVVDGSEPLDPANPDSVSNGIGGFNSVMTIGSELLKASGMFVKESYTQDGDSLKMTFNFVSSTNSENISEENIHIMFENHLLDSDMWKFDSDVLTIFGPAKGKSGMLRIFAENDDGIVTRENQTLIKSGQPITPQYYPNDWHFSVIYSIIVDRFFDGDLSNNRPVQDDEIHPL